MRATKGDWYYVAIPLCTILSIVVTLIFLRFSCQIANESHRALRILLMLCSVLSVLGCYDDTARFILSSAVAPNNLLHNKWINVASDIFHFGGQFLFYLIALVRIHQIFKETIYALSTRTLGVFVFLIVVQSAWTLWHFVNVIQSFFVLGATNEETLHRVRVIPVKLMCLFSFVLNSSLIILFIVKLRYIFI